jgi:hypothetical protein
MNMVYIEIYIFDKYFVRKMSSIIHQLDVKMYQKLMFLSNALDGGWSVKKKGDSYIFTKKHENKREVFQEKYLETFLITNSTGNLNSTI